MNHISNGYRNTRRMMTDHTTRLKMNDIEDFDKKMSIVNEISGVLASKNCKLEDAPKILKQTDEMIGYLKEKGVMGEMEK